MVWYHGGTSATRTEPLSQLRGLDRRRSGERARESSPPRPKVAGSGRCRRGAQLLSWGSAVSRGTVRALPRRASCGVRQTAHCAGGGSSLSFIVGALVLFLTSLPPPSLSPPPPPPQAMKLLLAFLVLGVGLAVPNPNPDPAAAQASGGASGTLCTPFASIDAVVSSRAAASVGELGPPLLPKARLCLVTATRALGSSSSGGGGGGW